MTATDVGCGQDGGVMRVGTRAWMTCMERREELAFSRLMSHVHGCVLCTGAVDRGDLLDAGRLCAAGSRALAAWDAAEGAIASAVLPQAVPA